MTIHDVVVNGDTTGKLNDDVFDGEPLEWHIGEVVVIHSHDENGNHINCSGLLTHVLS